MPRQRGQLEQQVMELLWSHPDGMTARQVVETVSGEPPALTTVLTVLERLRLKGRVTSSSSGSRQQVFSAVASESEHVVSSMIASLTRSSDRHAALLSFAGELDDADQAFLRQALSRRPRH